MGIHPAVNLMWLSKLVTIQKTSVSFLGGSCFLYVGDPSAKNWMSFIKFIQIIVPTNWKKRNPAFSKICHCGNVPECSLSGHNFDMKCHDQLTHICEYDNKYLMNG